MTIVNGALVDTMTSSVVATRQHETEVSNALTVEGAPNVQFITTYGPDGSYKREAVYGFTRQACESVQCFSESDDGFNYIYTTESGAQLLAERSWTKGAPAVKFSPYHGRSLISKGKST